MYAEMIEFKDSSTAILALPDIVMGNYFLTYHSTVVGARVITPYVISKDTKKTKSIIVRRKWSGCIVTLSSVEYNSTCQCIFYFQTQNKRSRKSISKRSVDQFVQYNTTGVVLIILKTTSHWRMVGLPN